MIKIVALATGFITKLAFNLFLVITIATILFVAYRGNKPMQVAEAPIGMTYFQFMEDRLDAAKTVKPARCGTGMVGSLFILGPFYATLYTHVGIHPDGFLAKVTAPDPDMPKNVSNANWYEISSIWWNTFERLSWTMLVKHHPGCNLRPITMHQEAK